MATLPDPAEVVRAFESGEKFLALTRAEAEMIMDSFKVSAPTSRSLALKAAAMVLEWAAEGATRAAAEMAESEAQRARRLLTSRHEPLVGAD